MKSQPDSNFVDLHFGTEEQMLAWCEMENITPVKDSDGLWDWHAAWDVYSKRLEAQEKTDSAP